MGVGASVAPTAPAAAAPAKPEQWKADEVRDWVAKSGKIPVKKYDSILKNLDGPSLMRATPEALEKAGMKKAHVAKLMAEVERVKQQTGVVARLHKAVEDKRKAAEAEAKRQAARAAAESAAAAAARRLDFTQWMIRTAGPVLQASERAPFLKPLANALALLMEQLARARIQRENCIEFCRLLESIAEAVQAQAAAGSLEAPPQRAAVRQLTTLLRDAQAFVSDFSRPAVLARLQRAQDDCAAFGEYTRRAASFIRGLSNGTGPGVSKVDQIMAEHNQGRLFRAEDASQAEVRARAEAMGGVARLQRDPDLREVFFEQLAGGDAIVMQSLVGAEGVIASILHPELRDIWRTRIGPNKEEVLADFFLALLSDFMATHEARGVGRPYAGTAARLASDQDLRTRVLAALDLNGNGILSIAALNTIFMPLEASLEDVILDIAYRPTPANLFPLRQAHYPRPEYQEPAARLLRLAHGLIVLEGAIGSGKTTVALNVAQELIPSGRYPGGIFFVDCRRRCSAPAVVGGIAVAMHFPLETTTTVRELAACVKRRIQMRGSVCLVLDSVDDSLQDDAEGTRALLHTLSVECQGVSVVVTGTMGCKFPAPATTLEVHLPTEREVKGIILAHLPGNQDHARFIDDIYRTASGAGLGPADLTCKEATLLGLAAAARTRGFSTGPLDPEPVLGALLALSTGVRQRLTQLAAFPGSFSVAAAAQVAGSSAQDLAELALMGLAERVDGGRWSLHLSVTSCVRWQLPQPAADDLKVGRSRLVRWVLNELSSYAALFQAGMVTTALAFVDRERPSVDEILSILAESCALLEVDPAFIAERIESSWPLLISRIPPKSLLPVTTALVKEFTGGQAGPMVNRLGSASAWSVHGLALYGMCRFQEALVEHRRSLSVRQVLGDLAGQADSLHCSGSCLNRVGRLEEAVTHHKQALQLRVRVFGPRTPKAADSMNSLGTCLLSQGRLHEAREALQEALSIRVAAYGPVHPDVAQSHTNRGSILQALTLYDEAEASYQEAVQVKQQLYRQNPLHRELAAAYDNLAGVLMILGRIEEAREIYDRALSVHIENAGPTSIDVAGCLANIGTCELQLGRYLEALELQERALKIRLEAYKEDEGHKNVARSYMCIAAAQQSLGRFDDALTSSRKAVEARLHLYGPRHHQVAAAISHVAGALYGVGRYSEAARDFREALKIRREDPKIGPDHPDTARTLAALGSCVSRLGDHSEAAIYHQQAVAILTGALGADHLSTLSVRYSFGRSLIRAGALHYEEAAEELQAVLRGRLTRLGKKHPATADSKAAVGLVLHLMGRSEEAFILAKEAAETLEAVVGPSSLDTAEAFHVMGVAMMGQRRLVEARGVLQRALDIRRTALGGDHPDTRDTSQAIAELSMQMHAETMAERAAREQKELKDEWKSDRERVVSPKSESDSSSADEETGSYLGPEYAYREELQPWQVADRAANNEVDRLMRQAGRPVRSPRDPDDVRVQIKSPPKEDSRESPIKARGGRPSRAYRINAAAAPEAGAGVHVLRIPENEDSAGGGLRASTDLDSVRDRARNLSAPPPPELVKPSKELRVRVEDGVYIQGVSNFSNALGMEPEVLVARDGRMGSATSSPRRDIDAEEEIDWLIYGAGPGV